MKRKIKKLSEKYETLQEWQQNGNHAEALDVENAEKTVCANCKTVFRGNYCPGCGQPASTSRFDFTKTGKSLFKAFNSFDKGFKHTVIELLLRPGYMIRDYLSGHCDEYVKPVRLLFLTTTILLFLNTYIPDIKPMWLHEFIAERVDEFDDYAFLNTLLHQLNDIMGNYVYRTLFGALVCTLPMWFIFRKTRVGRVTNLSETFFMLVYMSCSCVMFAILSLPIQYLYNLGFDEEGYTLCLPFYFQLPLEAWIIQHFYKLSFLKSFWKNILFYILLYTSIFVLICIPCLVYMIIMVAGDFG